MIVFANGKLIPEKKASLSIYDHGFLYGDGVYETIRVYSGRPFLLHGHLRRLNNSMLGIRLSPPLSLMDIGHAIQKTVQANRHKEAVVRLTVSRGPGAYGFDPALCKSATIVITSTPFKPYPLDYHRKGIVAAVVNVRRNNPVSLPPSVKSTSCMNGILAKMESLEAGAQEGILITHDNFIAEGTVSNVFIVKNGKLLTPQLDGTMLAGVTREWVCGLAKEAGLKVEEKRLPVAMFSKADEVFLTNTTMEVMPVSRLILNLTSQRRVLRFGVGPVTLDLMSRFKRSLRRFQQA